MSLLAIVEHVSQGAPPIRAARCSLRGHVDRLEEEVATWLSTPGARGLAILVVEELPNMAEPVAVRLARAALDGPYADVLRPRLAKSSLPAV